MHYASSGRRAPRAQQRLLKLITFYCCGNVFTTKKKNSSCFLLRNNEALIGDTKSSVCVVQPKLLLGRKMRRFMFSGIKMVYSCPCPGLLYVNKNALLPPHLFFRAYPSLSSKSRCKILNYLTRKRCYHEMANN